MVLGSSGSSSAIVEAALQSTRAALTRELPHIALVDGTDGNSHWLRPSEPTHGDYAWSIWFHPDGECQIFATLVESEALAAGEGITLWYHPFELDSHGGSQERLSAAFESELLSLFRSPTRVTLERGALNWRIWLDRQESEDQWHHVYTFYALRLGWEAPKFEGSTKTFYAPAQR